MTDKPIRPTNVRIRHADGSETPCELAYRGRDSKGMHMWSIAARVRPGDRLLVQTLPPKTGIDYDVAWWETGRD